MKAIVLILLIPNFVFAKSSNSFWEAGVLVQNSYGQASITPSYSINRSRTVKLGIILGHNQVFVLDEAVFGVWAQSVFDHGLNFHAGVSYKFENYFRLKVGAGVGTERYEFADKDSSTQSVRIKRIYNIQGLLGLDYKFESFSVGVQSNNLGEIGLSLGMGF